MEPTVPKSLEYEVRCPECRTSFARGTRRCIHCGGRLGSRAIEFPELAGFPGEGDHEAEAAEEAPEASPGRALVWVATAVLALVGTLIRMCQGG